jgi:pimeloyl-ACP methyl ester carboxylesterase
MSEQRVESASKLPIGPEPFELEGTGARMIRGEARVVPDAQGSVVLIHGFKGFSRFAFFPHLADHLARAGVSAITFNMSGSGIGEDMETFSDPDAFAENTYTRELQDLSLVLAESKRRGWVGVQYGLFGHSRGGAVALLDAARDARVRALVTWSSIGSVVRWSEREMAAWREHGYLEVPNTRTGQVLRVSTALLDEVSEHHLGRYNLRRAASTLLCPWLIVHGDADETVPIAEGEQLLAASEGRAEFLRVAGATHTFNVAHGMKEPSPQLRVAVDRTVRFFVERLIGRP